MSTGLEVVKKHYDKSKYMQKDSANYIFDSKIRWSNIGWQYNWDERCYWDLECKMDESLLELLDLGLATLKSSEILRAAVANWQGYKPESCIINYYATGDHMGGHLDDGEPDQFHPIFSFSLGLSAVFLLGGRTK